MPFLHSLAGVGHITSGTAGAAVSAFVVREAWLGWSTKHPPWHGHPSEWFFSLCSVLTCSDLGFRGAGLNIGAR